MHNLINYSENAKNILKLNSYKAIGGSERSDRIFLKNRVGHGRDIHVGEHAVIGDHNRHEALRQMEEQFRK